MYKVKPDSSWVGKWMSVVGLMEPPYVSRKYRYSHLTITMGAAGQMTVITEKEAQWRLAGAGRTAGSFKGAISSNQQTLDRIKGVSGASAPPAVSRAPIPVTSSNSAVLQTIRAASGSPPPAPPSSARGRYNYRPPPRQPGVIDRIFKWLLG